MKHATPALFVAAATIAACGRDISLGDVPECLPPNACMAASDAAAGDASAPTDAGPGHDGDVRSDSEPLGDSAQAVDSARAADAGVEADSSQPFDSGQPDGANTSLDGGVFDGAPAGSVVTGSADGTRLFGSVSNAWWIQSPDPRVTGGPIVSTVVYLFSKPVDCAKLTVPKWDENNEPGDTQNLEIETGWSGATEPSAPPAIDYSVVTLTHAAVPDPGFAGVFYQVVPLQPPGPLSELAANSGTVTLTVIHVNTNIAGTFNVTFAAGRNVSATFDATYCPNGREP